MQQVIVITGASSGFGRLSANALAKAGHIVYASMRGTTGRNAAQAADVRKYATDNKVDLHAIELDVGSQASADAAIAQIVSEQGRLDVVMHNAGHMSFGPAEAFTPEQLAELYDVNVLSTQRVNRAALPQLRKQGRGLVGLGLQQQFGRRYAALPRAVFCRKGRHGRDGGGLCARTVALGHRNLDHRARRLHRRHQSFCALGQTCRPGPDCRIRSRSLCRLRRRDHEGVRRDRATGCRCCLGRGCHRRASSMRRSASGRSAFISIRPRTAPKSPSP